MTRSRNAENQRRWRQRHPEKSLTQCRAYYAANRQTLLDRKRDYYQHVRKPIDATEEGRARDRDRKARRRSLTGQGTVSQVEWQAIVKRFHGCCAYCGRDDLPLEQDHVIPLSKGGLHCAANVVPACKPCNSAKGAR